MPTISAGSVASVFCPLASTITITPGSAGRVSMQTRSQTGGQSVLAQEIYSAATISVSSGDTVTMEAINTDATYTTPAGADSSLAAVLSSGVNWADLPTPSANGVGLRYVLDVGARGSLWYSNGTTWGLANGSCILGQSAVAVSCTASTSEEVLQSIALPAGVMGINGALRLTTLWSCTGAVGTKTLRARLGTTALGGSAWFNLVRAAAATDYVNTIPQVIRNRNAANSQVVFAPANPGITTSSVSAPSSFTEDTSAALIVSITGQKATAGEVLTLEAYTLELLRP